MNSVEYLFEILEKYNIKDLNKKLNYFFENNIEFSLPDVIDNYSQYSTYYQSHFRGYLISLLYQKKVIIISKRGNGDYLFKITSKI